MKYDLEDRLIKFALLILKVTDSMRHSFLEHYLKKQLTRSCLSSALNYGEAQSAESRADFIHKMRLCLKELRETQVCLKIIHRKPVLCGELIGPAMTECSELVAIFTNSIKTASNNTKRKR
jgi:four helix bundle protein